MPTKTFFNLPLEKQKNLIEASEREFSRVLFAEASINQIIQDAKISRGSFYMYFKDKEDLYYYIFEKHTNNIYQLLLDKIISNHGDFIKAAEELYEHIIDFCMNSKHHSLFRNLFLSMRYETNHKMNMKQPKEVIEKNKKEILSSINNKLYSFTTDEELIDAFSMIMMITTGSIVYTFMNPAERKQEQEKYIRRLYIIKYGLYNKKEETNA